MQIRCPECNTLFQSKESDLRASNSQVQCGHCFHIFQAKENQESFALAEEDNTADIDINTFADAIDHIPKEEVIKSGTMTTAPIFEPNVMVDDIVPPELRQQTPTSSTLVKSIWSLGILCLTIAASVQLIYFKRAELTRNAELRPYLISFCKVANCEIPELKDIRRLELATKNVYSHPNVDNALMITAVIINQASFSQQFPSLQVSFTNLVGDIVMARQFKPSEYLNTSEDKLSDMQPGLPIQIILEVIDPGKNATAYEFSFI